MALEYFEAPAVALRLQHRLDAASVETEFEAADAREQANGLHWNRSSPFRRAQYTHPSSMLLPVPMGLREESVGEREGDERRQHEHYDRTIPPRDGE